MIIAVNTRFLLKDQLEGVGYFTKEVLQYLVRQYPQHQFHFLFDRPYSEEFIFAANVKPHIVKPPARHPLLWKIWFDVSVSLLLKKIKPDVFLSPDGQCALFTSVHQCLVIHDLNFLHFPATYPKAHLFYLKKYTSSFIKKAKTVITVSNFSKQDIIQQYKTPEQKINVVYNGVKEIFQPVDYNEQDKIREKYTGGLTFFLYAGAVHPRKNLVALLKAFSIFKRRLHSSMKLVIAGRLAWKNNAFLELLKTYKYRDDVVLTGYLEETELAGLMASAYALVYPSLFEGFGVPVIEAMRCGVPVLTSRASAMEEISDGAALCFDPMSVEDIADKLMMVYKDESGRKLLIEKGFLVAQKYTWKKTAEKVWESLLTAAEPNFKP